MFNYNVNWFKILKENIPAFLHKDKRLNFLESLIKPLKVLHAEFMLMVADFSIRARFTSEKQYLEKVLNVKFDPFGLGIFITNTVPARTYIFNPADLQPERFVFDEWKIGTAYVAGEFVQQDLGVYKALAPSVGLLPSANPAHWAVELFANEVVILRQQSEFSPAIHYIVHVPNTIPFDEPAMRAVIDQYNLAGIEYDFLIY